MEQNVHMNVTMIEFLLAMLNASNLTIDPDEFGNASEPPPVYDLGTQVTMTLLYALIMVTGVLGNICTCMVIALNRYMHTATNYYLFSLSISDLLLLTLGLPHDTYELWRTGPYQLGEAFCIVRGFLSETATNASILTITAFTIERYVAICHPLRSHRVSTLERAVKTILIVWVTGGICAYPVVSQYGVLPPINGDGGQCTALHFKPTTFFISTIVFFILPLTLIVILYILIGLQLRISNSAGTRRDVSPDTRPDHNENGGSVRSCKTPRHTGGSKRAVVKMLVAVVIAFFICWTPFHAQRLFAVFMSMQKIDSVPDWTLAIYKITVHLSGVTYYCSATINPILYQLLSLKFRQAFRDTFYRCCTFTCCGGNGEDSGTQFTTSFYNHGGITRSGSTRGSLVRTHGHSSPNAAMLERSAGTRSAKLCKMANSELLPLKEDNTNNRKPLTDSNGLLTVDSVPVLTTPNELHTKDVKEKLIVPPKKSSPQVIVTQEA